ncbi:MAG: cation transporter [Bacteroidota bacterium]
MEPAISSTAQRRGALKLTFALTAFYLIVEVMAGLFTKRFALLADAAHMLADVAGHRLALFLRLHPHRVSHPDDIIGEIIAMHFVKRKES